LTRHLGRTILALTIVLKSQEITEINAKSSQNAYEIYKLMNFCKLTKKTGKKNRNIGQTYVKFAKPT